MGSLWDLGGTVMLFMFAGLSEYLESQIKAVRGHWKLLIFLVAISLPRGKIKRSRFL